MHLYRGSLYWPTTYLQAPTYKPLQEDISCEVLIIGGGESGAKCAYFLAQAGVDTVLIDKRKVAQGSTSANTGLVQYANDKTLTSCIHSFGVEKAVRHYRLCQQAVETLENIVPSLPVNPDFIKRDSLYFASSDADVHMLKEEYTHLFSHQFSASLLTAEQIKEQYGFKKPLALYTVGDAEVNPFKLAISFVQDAVTRGLRVFEQTAIVGHQKLESGMDMITNHQHRIRAKHVIFATGYESQAIKPDKNAILTGSFAIVTNVIDHFEGWHHHSLIWETERPYLYLRTTVDNRIIIGGLDEEKFDKEALDSRLIHKRELLLQELALLFPQYAHVKAEFEWGAIFGSTHSGLPMIQQYEQYPNCYFLLGYGGNGTVYSVILAQILRDVITKGHHPDLCLYQANKNS
ncbi:NAD(P)/FAD-dependent oxidoreductase [Metabacillus iocasae]|uniref:Glycine/D-amino acid oxidase-like deaminating enzyme n=1 Tax=Priestia iocasae TaxID=2291674 RepID=A0ABS2R027_9BACI|nr:FAD-binding oxidoreductase [Metabacillus iocasae]MBM7704793.1 glycine/D-amino acid oxidase-like deaminating enzyme [Metabacillus iocasae]